MSKPDNKEFMKGILSLDRETIENRHHISYPRRKHTTDLQRAYRHFGLMVVHMEVKPHNELHATVPPMPRLPSKPILERALGVLATVAESNINDPLFTIERLACMYGTASLETDDIGDARYLQNYEEHLHRQYQFIRDGNGHY